MAAFEKGAAKGQKQTIDGLFLTQRITGIQRYARETCRALDSLLAQEAPGGPMLELAVPKSCLEQVEEEFPHISVVRVGRRGGFWWEQVTLPRYLAKKNQKGIYLCNVMPLAAHGGTAAIHDISYRVNPAFFRSLRDRLSAAWHCLQYQKICRSADIMVAVSEFSRQELLRVYSVPDKKVAVAGNAWQHMNRVAQDAQALIKYSLTPGSYCFCMATLAKNKNLDWILRAARQNPTMQFVIAGGGTLQKALAERALELPKNARALGYISDGEAKALMAGCRAFLFPTFYEGFGIPPLEAAACGAPVLIVSDTPCMHEVYGAAAVYCNPNAEQISMTALLHNPPPPKALAELLARYSWKATAERWLAVLRERA